MGGASMSKGGGVLSHFHRPQNDRCVIACAGTTTYVRTFVRKLCMQHPVFRYCGHVSRRSSGLQLANELLHSAPDIVLMDGALLNRCGLAELAQIHRALPKARIILIGGSVDLTSILSAVRQGMRGILPSRGATLYLERALRAVADGDLWLSRHQLAYLVIITSAEPENDLLELTPRENLVMRGALLGQSNKQIARALNIAEHTVKIHLHHIYAKLHVHRRAELLVQYHHVCMPSGRNLIHAQSPAFA
jgi:two-component system, NarL family, nitrate/nitrite response regulator NarL